MKATTVIANCACKSRSGYSCHRNPNTIFRLLKFLAALPLLPGTFSFIGKKHKLLAFVKALVFMGFHVCETLFEWGVPFSSSFFISSQLGFLNQSPIMEQVYCISWHLLHNGSLREPKNVLFGDS